MAETNVDELLLGFCDKCGEALYPAGTTKHYDRPHVCEPPDEVLDVSKMNPLIRHLVAALENARAVIDGTAHDRERSISRVRRALWLFQLTDDDRLFYSFRTTAEMPTVDWDEI